MKIIYKMSPPEKVLPKEEKEPETDLTPPPSNASEQNIDEMNRMVEMMYGKDGLLLRMGIVGENLVVGIGDKDLMARTFSALKGKEETGRLRDDSRVKELIEELPEDAGLIVVFSPVNFLDLPTGMAGFVVSFPTADFDVESDDDPSEPEDFPLAIISGSVRGNIFYGELHLPIETIQAIVERLNAMHPATHQPLSIKQNGTRKSDTAAEHDDDDEEDEEEEEEEDTQ